MPEIKEIRKFADLIRKRIKGREIIDVKILKGRYKIHGPPANFNVIKKNLPLRVVDVKSKGKLLYIEFQDSIYIFNALGLTGGWCYQKKGAKKYEFSKNLDDYAKFLPRAKIEGYMKNAINHLNIEFKTRSGSLYYFDVTSFGSMKIITDRRELDKKLQEMGPDIMEPDTDYDLFQNRIRMKKNLDKPIGIVMVNQKIISGIGNYLRSEILYAAKIDPFRKVKKLNNNELKKIFRYSKILTWGDYDIKYAKKIKLINSRVKLPSDYGRTFFVYAEDTDIYGNPVVKKELYEGSQKRYIYYVPKIQK